MVLPGEVGAATTVSSPLDVTPGAEEPEEVPPDVLFPELLEERPPEVLPPEPTEEEPPDVVLPLEVPPDEPEELWLPDEPEEAGPPDELPGL